jgi:hypothetical protein
MKPKQKTKIVSYRDKTRKAFNKFMEASGKCEYKGDPIADIGCICKLEERWPTTCSPLHCILVDSE